MSSLSNNKNPNSRSKRPTWRDCRIKMTNVVRKDCSYRDAIKKGNYSIEICRPQCEEEDTIDNYGYDPKLRRFHGTKDTPDEFLCKRNIPDRSVTIDTDWLPKQKQIDTDMTSVQNLRLRFEEHWANSPNKMTQTSLIEMCDKGTQTAYRFLYSAERVVEIKDDTLNPEETKRLEDEIRISLLDECVAIDKNNNDSIYATLTNLPHIDSRVGPFESCSCSSFWNTNHNKLDDFNCGDTLTEQKEENWDDVFIEYTNGNEVPGLWGRCDDTCELCHFLSKF